MRNAVRRCSAESTEQKRHDGEQQPERETAYEERGHCYLLRRPLIEPLSYRTEPNPAMCRASESDPEPAWTLTRDTAFALGHLRRRYSSSKEAPGKPATV